MSNGFLDVDGGRLYYEVDGDGEPLLLIHGGLGSLRMWDGQVPHFAERYRVIRYDTRGFGRSETEDVQFSEVADIRAVLDHFGVETAYVVGQSRGGMFALDFLIQHPDCVRAFVSVASGIGGYRAELPDAPTPPWGEMERLWEAKDWEGLAELETQTWVDGWGQPQSRVDAQLRERVKGWIVENYRAEKVEGKPRAAIPPAAERLGEIRAPVLVMVGDADEAFGLAAGRYLAAHVAGAELVEFPGVAHMIQLEEPERFIRLVLDFLEKS